MPDPTFAGDPLVAEHPLAQRIAAVLALAPTAGAVEFDGHWHTRGEIDAAARRVATLTAAAGRPPIGILLRNRPEHVAALLGVLLAGGCVVTINPSRGADRIRTDIADLALPVLIGSPEDLAEYVAPHAGTTTVAITGPVEAPRPIAVPGPGEPPGPTAEAESIRGDVPQRPEVAVRMSTSGTTGTPKRIDLTYDMLARSVMGAEPERATAPEAPRAGVAIVDSPLVHISGVFRVLQYISEARPFVLLPRFELKGWADAVRRHRPGAVSLVPTALRMVLHSELTRDDLAGVRVVTSGTAPLAPEDADAFSEKFGIPVLTSYAATEFGGGVAGWTLPDHRRWWAAKRGSVGRASLGARLRVVDDDGNPLGADTPGLLEVIPGQLGPAGTWMRTTDLARIDADGFLWILGRADQAIIRGGFKVRPDDVRAALESHPAVRGAAVVGLPDPRLGATPAALVELRADTTTDADELREYLGNRLARYEIPTTIALVDAIPRTPSGKADLTAVREHLTRAAYPPGGADAR
ncbi:class I adenylate-forming enzyme family protein [Nocardia sp. alder85J]|uniref:class I adenylate-forming enzyme family protein n=1 Tax=Nocardia sp. alder85J TaxID=2862949 RepID=UPI001CD4B9D1|nr:AMP-binding protein [Nocardia sp. alder85J]MCX4096775.1 AMP-binding protein [Nocardia sp. alder85J]